MAGSGVRPSQQLQGWLTPDGKCFENSDVTSRCQDIALTVSNRSGSGQVDSSPALPLAQGWLGSRSLAGLRGVGWLVAQGGAFWGSRTSTAAAQRPMDVHLLPMNWAQQRPCTHIPHCGQGPVWLLSRSSPTCPGAPGTSPPTQAKSPPLKGH